MSFSLATIKLSAAIAAPSSGVKFQSRFIVRARACICMIRVTEEVGNKFGLVSGGTNQLVVLFGEGEDYGVVRIRKAEVGEPANGLARWIKNEKRANSAFTIPLGQQASFPQTALSSTSCKWTILETGSAIDITLPPAWFRPPPAPAELFKKASPEVAKVKEAEKETRKAMLAKIGNVRS